MPNEINKIKDWLPYKNIYENGIIKLKDNSYIKILKINPINYSLKSEIEKKAILNSYKVFLKTCDFNIQILIQSNKQELNQIISKTENQIKKENDEKENILSMERKNAWSMYDEKQLEQLEKVSQCYYGVMRALLK